MMWRLFSKRPSGGKVLTGSSRRKQKVLADREPWQEVLRFPGRPKIELPGSHGEATMPDAMQKQFNRRQFLKSTSVATATAPLLFSSAWGANAPKGPNGRITLGFIGTGTQGRGLLNNF